jgi:hypothetical protein
VGAADVQVVADEALEERPPGRRPVNTSVSATSNWRNASS